jgi:hypothetical protein
VRTVGVIDFGITPVQLALHSDLVSIGHRYGFGMRFELDLKKTLFSSASSSLQISPEIPIPSWEAISSLGMPVGTANAKFLLLHRGW